MYNELTQSILEYSYLLLLWPWNEIHRHLIFSLSVCLSLCGKKKLNLFIIFWTIRDKDYSTANKTLSNDTKVNYLVTLTFILKGSICVWQTVFHKMFFFVFQHLGQSCKNTKYRVKGHTWANEWCKNIFKWTQSQIKSQLTAFGM